MTNSEGQVMWTLFINILYREYCFARLTEIRQYAPLTDAVAEHEKPEPRAGWATLDARRGKTTSGHVGCPFAACLQTASRGPRRNAEGEGGMAIRVLIILAAISFSASAFAQTAPPKIGDKPLVQVKPEGPNRMKHSFVPLTVPTSYRVPSELRGAISATETQSFA